MQKLSTLSRSSGVMLVVVAVSQTGCHGGDSNIEQPDARAEADATVDAPVDAAPPRCDPVKPFASPVMISELALAQFDEAPYFSPDELTIYFSSTLSGGQGLFDVYMATRASRTDAFGDPVPVPGINGPLSDRFPAVTADGLTIYVTRVSSGLGDTSDILSSTRASVSDPFPPLTKDAFFSSNYRDEGMFLLPDRTAIWWSDRQREPSHATEYIATWNGTSYGAPVPMYTLNLDDFPNNLGPLVMTGDKLTVYFSSGRGGNGSHVWMAKRADPSLPFETATSVTELNASDGEYLSWVSADGCVIAFYRPEAGPMVKMYIATKPL